jgi:hypothetical protein
MPSSTAAVTARSSDAPPARTMNRTTAIEAAKIAINGRFPVRLSAPGCV